MSQDVSGLHAGHTAQVEVQVTAADGSVGHTQDDVALQCRRGECMRKRACALGSGNKEDIHQYAGAVLMHIESHHSSFS